MVRIERAFRAPCSVPNGLQATPEGLWVVDQVHDNAMLLDERGNVIRDISTECSNSSGVTFGDGALWMAYNGPPTRRERRPTDREGHHVLKVDPHTGATLGSFPIPEEGGVHGLEWRDGYLWVTNPTAWVIYQIDPRDYTVVRRLSVGRRRSHGLAWEGGYLWCVHTADRVIDRLDVGSGQVLETIEIPEPEPEPHGLTWWQGGLIYCDAESAQLCWIRR